MPGVGPSDASTVYGSDTEYLGDWSDDDHTGTNSRRGSEALPCPERTQIQSANSRFKEAERWCTVGKRLGSVFRDIPSDDEDSDFETSAMPTEKLVKKQVSGIIDPKKWCVVGERLQSIFKEAAMEMDEEEARKRMNE
eukprot:gnl/MRDRNA2_/MRDRNA2_216616_c0_seq1.p1 gnl/MRDRNA2_/MRDRNA2_216616_c0~~gnl/MRDRNA2_/MRDRNA2_216616_c0_seq1.p1  ORF type:complete len:151 (+),score=30.84 gnl/MRDRNA2_/MRDRNA2_216616_c0_seq1:41-454(+)